MHQIIINPASSSGKGLKVWKMVKAVLDSEHVDYDAHIMSEPGEATALTRRLTSFACGEKNDVHLLVVGGDGTLNEVLNGIEDFEHTTFSCIQNGSGNDFARNINLEKDIEKAVLHLVKNPEETYLDYGEVTTDYKGAGNKKRFLISCGVGYDADICEEVGRSKLKELLNKLHLGKLVYVIIGVKQIFSKKTSRAKLYLDNGPMIKLPSLFFVVGMNHIYEGGGVPFCPKANPTDGMFDVCLVKGMPRIKLLLAVVLVYFKKHLLFKNITNHRCRRMRLITEKPQWIHMDGEVPYQVNEVIWECKSGQLRFVK